MICDVLITKFYSENLIVIWAEFRSLFAIASVLCLIGLDQVLVRSPQSSRKILRLLAIQIPILALIWGIIIHYLGFASSWMLAIFLCVGSAGSYVFFQYFRSHGHRVKSQLSQQSWKILTLVSLIVLFILNVDVPPNLLVVTILCLTIMISCVLAFRYPPDIMLPQNPETVGDLYKIGSRFMASTLLLSLSIYAEQLVVNSFGSTAQAATYFTHATYFLFPISLANGYFAFLIGPWIRDNHDRFVSILRSYRFVVPAGIVVYVLAVQLIGYIGWEIVTPTSDKPDILLQIFFVITCFARTLYTLPSAYLGIFGAPRQHDSLIIGQTIALILAIGLFALLFSGLGAKVLYAVAFASMINWLFRVLIGAKISQNIIQSKVNEQT